MKKINIRPITGTITHMGREFMRIELDAPSSGYIIQPIPHNRPLPKRGEKVTLITPL